MEWIFFFILDKNKKDESFFFFFIWWLNGEIPHARFNTTKSQTTLAPVLGREKEDEAEEKLTQLELTWQFSFLVLLTQLLAR